jgi:ribonucleoside-diphosphate reductase alpha chain/ribonucleoside-diphosphate reductase subunit M1
MYYLRSLPKADAIQFTVDQAALTATRAASAPAAGGKPAATTTTGATKGLAFEEEPACESCSA